MREITPINIWTNGQNVQATQLQLYCINDNLINSASFYYALFDVNTVMLSQGNLSMVSPDYETDWNTNDQAWNWAAKTLNLTFAPTTTTSTTTTI